MEVNNIIDWNRLTPTQQIQHTIQANNSWSAAQAQKQMDFQREMSDTAHQREVADLKAAGLNPVLSAKLGGASTPSGAMAQGDTSGTQALVDLLSLSMQAVNSAAQAANGAVAGMQSGDGKILGLDPLNFKYRNPRNAMQMAWNAAMDLASEMLGDKNWTLADIKDFGAKVLGKADNSAKDTQDSITITIPGTSTKVTLPKVSGSSVVPNVKALGG